MRRFLVIPAPVRRSLGEGGKAGIQILIILFCSSCALNQPPSILNALNEHQQVIIVYAKGQGKPFGNLSAWEQEHGHWKHVYSARVILGRNGLAALDTKREGDGHTPSGIFPISTAFGYDVKLDTKLEYRQATSDDFWVDDVKSPQYNQWVHYKPNADSFEIMKRKDNLYSMGAVIEYNTNPIIPGNGSAIFLHIWRSYYKPTAGCVAASKRDIRRLLKWLDKNQNPIIVL